MATEEGGRERGREEGVVVFNDFRLRGLRHGARDVGQTAVGRCLSLLGPVGRCLNSRPASCEGEGDVVGVVAPLDGVAQVIFHGVQVVEVGVQVRVHEEGEKEKDGEVQVEVERGRRESRTTTHV